VFIRHLCATGLKAFNTKAHLIDRARAKEYVMTVFTD
jgi:hypothetical protein